VAQKCRTASNSCRARSTCSSSRCSSGVPQHGHGIGQAIRIRSQEALQVEHGSLYPALHRLERQGWLASEWKMSEANRRARYYKLTPKGRRQLLAEQSRWKQLVRAVARTMKPVKE
jgi:PadR family transcriptional regulator, regulatory protein PadR